MTTRNSNICNDILNGASIDNTALKYNLSKQRVHQIFRSLYPDLPKRSFGKGKMCQGRLVQRQEEIQKYFNRDSYQDITDLQKAQSAYFTRKRENTKRTRHEWAITMADLEWPLVCPILGCELDWFADTRQENSPSIDRRDSSKGYIPGNVRIISWRANRIKNDGTAEEHEAIARYLKS